MPRKALVKASKSRETQKTKTAIGLRTERVPVKLIKPAAYNPRKDLRPGDPEYDRLRRSLDTFGYVDPLIWNRRTGNLVGGHQRFKILVHEYGASELDVAVVDLPLPQEKALNVALNKIQGDWETEALGALLRELDRAPDVDATLTGFERNELQRLLARLDDAPDTSPKLVGLEHRIIVTCRDEQHQAELLGRFQREGIPCQALIS